MLTSFDFVPVDVKAAALSLACDRPVAVSACAAVNRRFAAAVKLYSEQVWGSAFRRVRWPPRKEALQSRYLVQLARIGHQCRRLEVNLWTCPTEDLMKLSILCTGITSLKMDGIGADGVCPEIWRCWGKRLEEIALRFIYYNDDGAPAMHEVLSQLACHAGPQLRRLDVSGFDYPGAKPACSAALNSRRGHFLALKRLRLCCSDDFEFQEQELAALRYGRPDCVIEVETYNALTGC